MIITVWNCLDQLTLKRYTLQTFPDSLTDRRLGNAECNHKGSGFKPSIYLSLDNSYKLQVKNLKYQQQRYSNLVATYCIISVGIACLDSVEFLITVNGYSQFFVFQVIFMKTPYEKQHYTISITTQNFLPVKKNKHGICEFTTSPFQRSSNKNN